MQLSFPPVFQIGDSVQIIPTKYDGRWMKYLASRGGTVVEIIPRFDTYHYKLSNSLFYRESELKTA